MLNIITIQTSSHRIELLSILFDNCNVEPHFYSFKNDKNQKFTHLNSYFICYCIWLIDQDKTNKSKSVTNQLSPVRTHITISVESKAIDLCSQIHVNIYKNSDD